MRTMGIYQSEWQWRRSYALWKLLRRKLLPMKKYTFCLLIVIALCTVIQAASPYPDSTLVSGVSFTEERTHGNGADQWPMTVGSDGNVYALYADGDGWQSGNKDYLGVVMVTGTPGIDETGTNLWGDNQNDVNRKPLGIIGDADNVLRMFYHHSGARTVYTAESTNLGSSWSFNTTGVFDLNTDGTWVVGVAQYGAGYTGLPAHVSSTYYYVYISDREFACGTQGPVGQDVYLARVPKTQIATRTSYEYYNGKDAANNPIWSSNFGNKQAVYSDSAGMQYHISVVWNPGLQRYILAQASPQSSDENWLGLFEGPYPWGPWRTIYYGEFYPGLNLDCLFTFQTAQAWMSVDGTQMWLTWSGWPANDSVTFTQVDLTLSDPPDSTPPSIPLNLNATTQSDTRIDLSWSPSQDPESGILDYRVYRGGAVVGHATDASYSDTGLAEATTYTYAVSAVNGAGLESSQSEPVSGTTLADTMRPALVSAETIGDSTRVVLLYSEPVEESSATDVSNYSINNGIVVSGAALAADLTTVTLTTTALSTGVTYTLTVNSVRDRATTPNTIASDTTIDFEFLNLTTAEVRISDGDDDVEESEDGTVNSSSSDLEMADIGGDNQTIGLRFHPFDIPQGSDVVSAYLQFRVDEATSGAASLVIEGEAADNAAPFGTVSSRTRTSASIPWMPAPWPTVGQEGPDQRTADLASIIQEIVNRPGWESGNALGLIVTGSGTRTAESYQGSSTGAPLLHVEYVAEPSAQETPSAPTGLQVE